MINLKSFLTIIFLLLSANSFAQSSWQWANPLPQGQTMREVQYVNGVTGYAVSSGGIVLKTSNSGANWISLSTGTNYYLASLCFLNELTGFAAGMEVIKDTAEVLKTTNGGLTWNRLHTNSLPNGIINGVFFINESTGFVSQIQDFRTTDGGNSWVYQGDISSSKKFYFLNNNTGYTFGGNHNIYKTKNSGSNWTAFSQYSATPQAFIDIAFIDSVNWYAGGTGNTIFRSTNAGTTWDSLYTSFFSIRKVFFRNINTGYFINSNGGVTRTSNAGANWASTTTGASGYILYSFSFANAMTGTIVGDMGCLLRTTDGCVTWLNQLLPQTKDLKSITFINESTGFAVGGDMYGAVFLKTTNTGNLWTSIGGGTNYSNTCIYAVNEQTWFLGTSDGKLSRTTNAGVNWQAILITLGPVNMIYFTDANTGFFTNSSALYRTTNGGTNWSAGTYSYNLSFVNPTTGFGGNANGFINKTTDAGATWTSTSTGLTGSITWVTFLNPLTGYAVNGKNIIKTTNGGSNWTSVYFNTNYTLSRVKFYDDNTGYASGTYGVVLKTTNAGATWINELVPCNYTIADLFVTSENKPFICANSMSILMPANTLTGIGNNAVILENYLLEQNFPNPFNPTTIIKYNLPNSNIVTLKVFDVNGKEIETLVNEAQTAGSYSVNFNAAYFPSGVYFYTLSAGEFKETRKMILIK